MMNLRLKFLLQGLAMLWCLHYAAPTLAQCGGVSPSFSVNGTGCGIPRNYTFTNNSTGSRASLATYIWRNGSSTVDTTTGTGSTPTIIINNPGVDTIWMVAVDTNGCRDSAFQIVTTTTTANGIFDPSTGTYNYAPLWENCILFLSSPDSFRIYMQSNGTLSNYRVIWGDGAQDSGSTLNAFTDLSHLYTALGTYTVRIVSQNGSCYDTVQGTVVNERIPTAGIIGPPAGGNVGCAPHTIRFINNSTNVSSSTIFRWNFGDGTTVDLPYTTALDTIYHTYTEGLCNGIVSVQAINACGSSTATWTPIFVNDRDDASWSMNTVNCNPALPFTFFNTSTNNYCTPTTRLFNWTFGDGTTTGWINTTTPQNHTFPRSGRYTVTLLDSNLCGVDTFRQDVIINFTPDAGFIYSNPNGCGPLTVTVIDTTDGLENVRIWNFGNGVTGSDSLDTMVYTTPGTYNLSLSVVNSCGSDVANLTVTVWSPPDATFSSIASGCSPLTATFTNNSTYFNDSTVTWRWDFGDGTDTNIRNPPQKVYTTPGTYTVWLYVYDTCGVDSFSRTFTVHPKPDADFNADTVCLGSITHFTNTSTVASGTFNLRSWRFGNPSQGTSSSTNPNFTFNAADTFDVRLIVRTNQSCRDTIEKSVIVLGNPTTSWAVSPNDTVCIGTAQTFNGTANPVTGTIASYSWDFDNGQGSSQEDTTYTFPTAGNYQVSFSVVNSFGCIDSAIGNIVVLPLPTVAFTADTACVGSITHFQDNSSVNPGSIVSRRWDLNNDGAFDSTSASTTFIYGSLGTRWVRLEATSNFGCVYLDSNQITVHPLPVPNLAVDSSVICTGDSITLSNTSTNAVSYTYDFGDGTTLNTTSTNPVRYAYSDSGIYLVRIYAFSDRGCIDSNSLAVTVRPSPLAQFTVNQQIACAPFNFVFTNTSLRSTDYFWFTDGALATALTNRPDTLVAADSQAFQISLVAINSGYSCPYDTFVLDIGTSRNPIADFVTNPDSGCGPLNVAFGNTSQFASSFFWDFRNGQTSSSEDTTVRFQAALVNDTTYTIKLYAYNWQGCPDSTERNIVVHPNPEVSFTQSNTDSCGPLTVAFSNTSVHRPGGSINDMTFVWSFSNGETSTSQDTIVEFLADNINDEIYTVQLIGYSTYGCPDTATSTVTVYPNPDAQFTQSQNDSCGPMSVTFTNTSDPNDPGTITDMTFQWNLGNGVTGTTQDIATSYVPSLVQDSVYTIQLIAYSAHGCPDTATNTVRVYPKPIASYTQSDTSGCGPLAVNFTNTSVPFDTSAIGDMTFQWNFGNGVTSSAQDTSVSFTAAAANDTVYTVRLIAFSEHGCADTFISTVRVHPGPVASFGVNQAIACAPFNFVFTNNSINSTNFYWAVDGVYGYNQTTRPDTLIVLDSQTFTISLVAETSFGCPNDTTDMVIGTSRNPIADFVTNPDSGCGPLNVAFGNTSQFASSFFWDFRNGQTSSSEDTSIRFQAALVNDTTYTIKLYAYNWQGCPDSTERNIVVHPNPEVSFTQSNTDSCGPLTVAFSNTSVHRPGGSINDMTFVWSFSNGETSTSQDTIVEFLADNINDEIYTVQLIGYSTYGCPDTATSTVTVYPNPDAQFTQSQNDSCGPMSVTFTNTSDPNDPGTIADMTFQWNLGNGVTGTTQDIATSYVPSLVQDSIYTIQLIAYSAHGCPDTATNTVRVYPKPAASFTQSDTSGCGPLLVNFTNTSLPFDTSAIGDMTFQWNFGNGITATTQDASVSFVAAAVNDTVYTVRLIASSEHGCLDTFISTVRVHPKPTVALAKDDSTGCDPVTVNFSGSGVNVAIYHWDFGDSATSTQQNPGHNFRAIPFDDTTYIIRLTGESPYGCFSDTVSTTVTVLGGPYAEFHPVPDSVCATTTAQMINNSLGATSYYWDFGNGDTSSLVSPMALFSLNPSADTTYHIIMVASNLSGCRDTAEGYVVVSPVPTAAFIVDIDTGCSPLSVQFTDQSVFAASYSWSYSTGTDTLQNPSFVFTNTGTTDAVYLAQLIVTNLGGCTDTATDLIRVYPDPTANFVITPSSGCGDLVAAMSNQSTPNDTGSIAIMSFNWDLGNGTSSTAVNPSSNYLRALTQDSVYTVRLIASSEHGCLDTTSRTVRTYPKPEASFTQSDTSGCGPLTIAFNNTSIPYDTGSIADMNFEWNFGNGFISYDRHDSITFYPAIGVDTVYTIRLIAFSEHGCRDTVYSTVRVHPAPESNFTRTPSSGCGPLEVTFTSTGTNINAYHWNFGNGTTSSLANPVATFVNALDVDTVYTVSLWTESIYLCPGDSTTRTVIVRPDPVANFTQNEDSVCGTSTIIFSNASTGANSYAWSFGNGNTSTNTNPQHSFAMNPTADTTYTLRLIASNFFNCRDTVYGSVTVFPLPTAAIVTDTAMGCNPLTVNFSHNSLLSTGFAWDFGNGNTSTSQTPSSVFTNGSLDDTLYTVQLRVSSVHGCLDSMDVPIRVFPDPTVEFTSVPSAGCGDLTIQFNNQSSPNDTGSISIMSFVWDLGNGNTSTSTSPSSLYLRSLTQDSVYSVELIGTSEHGCRDSISRDVRTFPKPLANFTQSDTSGCGPLTVSFTNLSIPYDTGSINNMTFIWNFGNGNVSSNRNDSAVFYPSLIQDTVYTVRLIAISEHGCRDTMFSTVRVHPDPNISYTQTPSSGCSPLTVNFNATGIHVQSWHWNFANGNTSTQEDPTEVFLGRPDFDTTYTVRLNAISPLGCLSDTLSSNVIVRLIPEASFVKSGDSICGPATIFFTNESTGANSYAWSFGDGSTSTNANPSRAYSMNAGADTSYIVRLIASNFFNCRDTAYDTVTIFPIPTAVIVTDTAMGCNPLTVNFSHNSLLSTGFVWDFGNGNTSTSQTPSSVFTNGSLDDTLYTIQLTVSSVHGCLDSMDVPIRVFSDPTVDFTSVPSAGCGDLTIQFNNQSSPNDTGSISIMSFVWDLGNGNTSTSTSPSSLYVRSLTQDSVYTVELIGTSEHGCRDSVSHDVRTFPKPLANFTQSDTSGCGPLTVSFTNLSLPYDTGSINNMTFIWNFGNGNVSSNRNDSVLFYPSLTQDTVYTVRLIAISEHGCRDTMFSTVRVHPIPTSTFSRTPTSGCGPLAVSFTSSVNHVQDYHWNMGDGTTSTQANPSQTYFNVLDIDTVYTISLWTESVYGCVSDTTTRTVTVRPDPVANFSQNLDSLCGTNTIIFSNASTGATSYAWSFGNGNTATNANPQHSFAMNPLADTTYTIRLIASNSFNCQDTAYSTVTIFPFPTAVIVTDTAMGCNPLTVNFSHTSLLSTGYAWDFGNGSTSTSQTPSSIFTNGSSADTLYAVQLMVTSVHGCLDSTEAIIRVFPDPTVEFVAQPTAGCGDLTINFNNQSSPNDTGSISIMSFVWDLGNGNTSTAANPSSLYLRSLTQDSVYTVELIGTSEHGCRDSVSHDVRTFPKPLANFTQSDTSGCGPLTVSFNNLSLPYDTGSINNMTFIWNFGNGLGSINTHESVDFYPSLTQDTVYTVRLIAISEHGCRDTMFSTVRVHPTPTSTFSRTPTVGCGPLAVSFTSSVNHVQDYHWDLGDGTTSTQANPSQTYFNVLDIDTVYTISLWTESVYGCVSDTTTRTVTVRPDPVANFSQNLDSLCGTSTIIFSNASTGATSYAWSFGNGNTATNANPQHSFAMNPLADTTYTIRLIASNFFNCRDTAFSTVTIFPFPTAQIVTDTAMGCNPLTVNFSHTSLLSTGYAWDFGNGNTSTSQTPSSIFTNGSSADTLYAVQLMVTSVHGCLDSTEAIIRVFPDPTVEFVAQPTAGCGDLTIQFNNQSSPNDTGSISIMSFVWDLGNGNTSTSTNPSSLYLRSLTQDSVYTVELIGTSEHGCRDSVSHDVRTFPKPLANFTQSDTSGCGPLSVSFNNLSIPYDTGSIGDMTFIWSFGNGLGSTSANNTVTFYPSLVQDTVYTVRLIAISEHGCRDTMFSTVRVHPDPNISYTQTPSSGCSPLTVNFNATGINVQTWHWDFANGNTSNQEDPTEVFLGRPDFDTTYVVRLNAISPYGCLSDTSRSNVVVRLIPQAAFRKSGDSLCGPNNIFFTNESTGANAYAWDFGDGATSASANPAHVFAMNPAADTTYIVRLIATNFFNCRDTAFDSVTIFPYPTAVIVTDTTMGCNPLTVNFSHNSLLSTGYSWDFGIGNGSNLQLVPFVFSNNTLYDTLYTVQLTVTSVHGCLDSTDTLIRVFPDPTVLFATQPGAGCGDMTVNFVNQSSPNDTGTISMMSFAWDLGNGNTSTATNPSSLYVRSLTQDSVYTIELIGTSEHGCRDSVSHDIRTFPKPLANFTQSDTSGCGPLDITFTNLSIPYDTGSINDMSFFWDFGNGLGSITRNNTVTFYPSLTQDTVYTVRLISLSEHGCRDTMFSTVRVHPSPAIAFDADINSGCGPLPVQFTSSVLNVETYYWDFGDGDTSHQANPIHVFQNRPDLDTSYTVRFWSQSEYGCWSDTLSDVIIVRPDPVANFSQNLDSLCGGGNIQYSNNSTLGYTYVWDFGDGSPTTTAVNPQHVFSELPFTDVAYPVQLIATSVYGCRDTVINPTTIFPLPDAQITHAPDSGCSPLLVEFGNLSTIAVSHSWSFGDNTTAVGDTLSHVFTNPLGIDQDFQIIMQAISIHGCVDRDTMSIRVHPLPRPNFVFSKTGVCDTSEYDFSNLSAGAILYEWNFGDGTGSFVDAPSHIYPTAVSSDTNFTATLIATTNRGCVDSFSRPVVVTPIMLARASTNNASGCPPLAVTFANNSTNATSFYWDFNDGFVSTASNPSHTFINPDQSVRVYNVQLIVSNIFGCADTAVVPVTVAPNIDANFLPSKTALCTVAEYNFTNISVGATSYQWTFGDGTTSTQNSPTHIFPTSLTQDTSFIVRLVARSAGGCFDTAYRTVVVHPIVTALFTVDNNIACGFMPAVFTNLSTNGMYHIWDFGDGTGSAQFSPTHPYGLVGTYFPSIEVFDAHGCSATYTLPNPIVIWEIPQANFIALPTTQRLPNATFNFTNLSLAIDPLTYSWNFGEPSSGANNTSVLRDPQHTYADSGTYLIRLIVDNGQCRDTIERTVRVEYYFPIAAFSQDPDTGCMEHTVNFTNESQYATSYRWFFGDGGQSTDENPTHTYINPGVYTVTLIAYGPGGVDDSTKIDQIVVIQKPYANFYTNPVVAWLPNTTFDFINTSLLATSYEWQIDGPEGADFASTLESPTFDLNVEGEYSIRLIAINDFGCRDTSLRENYIRVNADGILLVPDAFTPNGDGINDGFRPVFEGVERENYSFRVYNRWGQLIFSTEDIDEAWDGTLKGIMCESEVYVWQVQGVYYGKQHFEQKGRIMLLR